ncbi:hypothetical protein MPH_08519 [Macrophomina phaseolina MS6]|uniref:Lysine-specific metallo-endopeptidase domain-containing protein n=1 Tax=Macrophomina phaseolina (strain MS6) TaxID=1126212 RepID=K2RVV9_MACPH|nr:hypothetical protein MPH_08519 [Macrophomina phaseolina MS6]
MKPFVVLGAAASLLSAVSGAAISTLDKRHDLPFILGPGVSDADIPKLEEAWKDVGTLSAAAADISYDPSDISNVYDKYFSASGTTPERVRALFRSFAGRTQVYAKKPRPPPDWSTVTIQIDRTHYFAPGDGERTQATTFMYGLKHYASTHMETLGSTLLHELLHCTQLVKDIYHYDPHDYSWVPSSRIDDQMSPDSSVYSGMTYGVYPVQQLRVLRPDIASINNDNFMFFALIPYWYGRTRKTFEKMSKAEWFIDCGKSFITESVKSTKCNVQ